MKRKENLQRENISPDIVYQEKYNEMRRFRDYQVNIASWYTTIILGIAGVIITVKAAILSTGIDSLNRTLFISPYFKLILTIILIVLVVSSYISVRYVWLRNEETREYVTKYLEPKWVTYKPKNYKLTPTVLIVSTQIVILILALTIVWFP